MRTLIALFAVAAIAACPIAAGEYGSRTLSGWFNVTAPDGWQGRRYMDGSMIFAEEFDANGDGRMDVWRFYRRGILTSEERDTTGDGRVDLVTRYDSASGFVTAVLRDSNKRGVNDIEVERTDSRRWVIYQDRNLDGTTDRIVYVNAPPDLFEAYGIDPATTVDISSAIPRQYWSEIWSDDGFSGSITDYFRYNNRGVLTHYGQWNGRRIVWNRCPPDFVPRPMTPTLAGNRPAQQPAPAPVAAPQPQRPIPAERPGTVRDPFDLAAGRQDVDPYYGMEGQPIAPPAQRAPDASTAREGYAPVAAPSRAAPVWSADGMPPGDSAARAVPARMRPPGQTRSR